VSGKGQIFSVQTENLSFFSIFSQFFLSSSHLSQRPFFKRDNGLPKSCDLVAKDERENALILPSPPGEGSAADRSLCFWSARPLFSVFIISFRAMKTVAVWSGAGRLAATLVAAIVQPAPAIDHGRSWIKATIFTTIFFWDFGDSRTNRLDRTRLLDLFAQELCRSSLTDHCGYAHDSLLVLRKNLSAIAILPTNSARQGQIQSALKARLGKSFEWGWRSTPNGGISLQTYLKSQH